MKQISLFLVLLLVCGSVPAVVARETYAFVAKWGEYGGGSGQFYSPYGVAVDTGGYVYVVGLDNRVQKFTANGSFVTRWGANVGDGTRGSGPGQFYEPVGVAVDTEGHVYVVESGGHRVQKFTSTGGFVTTWGTDGSGDGQFDVPWGIAVDGRGDVYVADRDNERIQKFSPVLLAPGGAGIPTDTDGDGMCDDVNGNERRDFADVVLFFNQMTWIAENEPLSAFDYNRNGRIDFADVVWLFNNL